MTSYAVERNVQAKPEVIWDLLTDASKYSEWNPAVLGIEGDIADGNKIKLKSIVNPDREFKLNVSAVNPPTSMVWWDGMPLGLFKGVRTFNLTAQPDGTTKFAMEEVYSGLMAPLITKSIPDMTESFEVFGDAVKAEAEKRGA
jgi:hypothetical protein